jgi:mRNA-degrading endonuclease RelE of RelBE toxin-antitoxin system
MTINFNELPEFSKEYKRYFKKYRTLNSDFLNFKKIILSVPCGVGKHFNIITMSDDVKIIKARFFCRALKGSSLRIVYAYHKNTELIYFIELYFKGEKENEDRERIKAYLKKKDFLL